MTRQELYKMIKAEAIKLAEEELRTIKWSEIYGTGGKGKPDTKGVDSRILSMDWHPYYARIASRGEAGEGKGLKITLVVRDGELEYFRRRKQAMPDFETPAIRALSKTVQKYQTELVMVELIDNFSKTEDMEVTWQQ